MPVSQGLSAATQRYLDTNRYDPQASTLTLVTGSMLNHAGYLLRARSGWTVVGRFAPWPYHCIDADEAKKVKLLRIDIVRRRHADRDPCRSRQRRRKTHDPSIGKAPGRAILRIAKCAGRFR